MVNALFILLPFILFIAIGSCFEALSSQKPQTKYIFLMLFFVPIFALAFLFLRVGSHDAAVLLDVPIRYSGLGLRFSIDYLSSVLFFCLIIIAFSLCLIDLLGRQSCLAVFTVSLAFIVPFLFVDNKVVATCFLILFDVFFVVSLMDHGKKTINFRALSLFCRFHFVGDFLIFLAVLLEWRFDIFNASSALATNAWYFYWPALLSVGIFGRFLPFIFIQRKLFINAPSLSASVHGVFFLLFALNGMIFFRLTKSLTLPGFFYGTIFLFAFLVSILIFLCIVEKIYVQKLEYLYLMIISVCCCAFLFFQNFLVIWISLFFTVLFFSSLIGLAEDEKFIAKSQKGTNHFSWTKKMIQPFIGHPLFYTRLFATEVLVPFYSNFIFYRFFKIIIGTLNLPFKITATGNLRSSLFMMIFWIALFGCLWKVK